MPIFNVPGRGPVRLPDGYTQEEYQKVLQSMQPEYKPEYSGMAKVMSPIVRGTQNLATSFKYDLPALGLAALARTGVPALERLEYPAREMLEEGTQEYARIAKERPRAYETFEDVQGPLDVAGYGLERFGEFLPQAATYVTGAGLAGLGGRVLARKSARELSENLAKAGISDDIAKAAGAARSAQAAQGASRAAISSLSFGQLAPEVFRNVYEETGEIEPGVAALYGGLGMLVERIVPNRVQDTLGNFGKVKVAEEVAKRYGRLEAAKVIGKEAFILGQMEGLTEVAQGVLSNAAAQYVDKNIDLFSDKNVKDYFEQYFSAMFGAAGLGAAIKTPEAISKLKAPEAAPAAATTPPIGGVNLATPQTTEAPPVTEAAAPAAATAPPATTPPVTAPATPTTGLQNLSNMGAGMVDSLYEKMFQAYQSGTTMIAGLPEYVLEVAKERGVTFQSPADIKAFAQDPAVLQRVNDLTQEARVKRLAQSGKTPDEIKAMLPASVNVDAILGIAPAQEVTAPQKPVIPVVEDSMYGTAVETVRRLKKASISSLQRALRIGYNRAGRLLEQMERNGVVSARQADGSRTILEEKPVQEEPQGLTVSVPPAQTVKLEGPPEFVEPPPGEGPAPVSPEDQKLIDDIANLESQAIDIDKQRQAVEKKERQATAKGQTFLNALRAAGVSDKDIADIRKTQSDKNLDKAVVSGLLDPWLGQYPSTIVDRAEQVDKQFSQNQAVEILKDRILSRNYVSDATMEELKALDLQLDDVMQMIKRYRDELEANFRAAEAADEQRVVYEQVEEAVPEGEERAAEPVKAARPTDETAKAEDRKIVTRTVYRTGPSSLDAMDRTVSAKDVINYETEELGNEDIEIISDKDLTSIPANQLAWVTFDRESAEEYINEEAPEEDRPEVTSREATFEIIAKDSQGGYLIREVAEPVAFTPETYAQQMLDNTVPDTEEAYEYFRENQEAIEQALVDLQKQTIKQARTGTEKQIADVDNVAKRNFGEVVFQDGDVALIRGYGERTGNPLYFSVIGDTVGLRDIESMPENFYTAKQKAQFLAIKQEEERKAAERHQKSPFIKFDPSGVTASSSIPDEIKNILVGWKNLLKIKPNIYLTTISEAKANASNFTGPHRKIGAPGSGTEAGWMSKMPDGNYYIIFKDNMPMTKRLEVLAHELGHIHEIEVFKNVDVATHNELIGAFNNFIRSSRGKKARDFILSYRPRKVGKTTTVTADRMEDLTNYWRSFTEWYADQIARWATTDQKPLTVVEKFFKRLADALKSFYAKVRNQKYLPNETFKQYLEKVSANLDELAPPRITNPISAKDQMTLFMGEKATGKAKPIPEVRRIDPGKKKIDERFPALKEAASRLAEGAISAQEYAELANSPQFLGAIQKYDFVPAPATNEEAIKALAGEKKKAAWNDISDLQEGDKVGLRLDIPAYQDHGVWVNSIHPKGKNTRYASVSALTNAVFPNAGQKALNVALGQAKAPFARIEGSWLPITPDEAVTRMQEVFYDPAWTQVGYNPIRHSYFFDRATGREVKSADEVVQIGPLVLAKNAVFNESDYQEAGDQEIRYARTTAEGKTDAGSTLPPEEKAQLFEDVNKLDQSPEEGMKSMDSLIKSTPSFEAAKQKLGQYVNNATADNAATLLQFLNLRQLGELAKKDLPQVMEYYRVLSNMLIERDNRLTNASKLREKWDQWADKNPELAAALDKVILMARMSGIDPTIPEKEAKIKSKDYLNNWNKIKGTEGEVIFKQLRDYYKDQLELKRQILERRIMQLIPDKNKRIASINELNAMFQKFVADGPYFPLSRFGEYFVAYDIKLPNGETKPYQEMFESVADLRAHEQSIQKDVASGKIINVKSGVDTREMYSKGVIQSQFINKIFDAIDDSNQGTLFDDSAKARLKDDVYQAYLSVLPELSVQKHFIHAKKVAGASLDMRRAFSESAFHSAYHLARLDYGGALDKIVTDAQKLVDEKKGEGNIARDRYLGELKMQHQEFSNPQKHNPIWSKITNFAFLYYLTAPASALGNLIQTPVIGIPTLAGEFNVSFTKASSQIFKAFGEFRAARKKGTAQFDLVSYLASQGKKEEAELMRQLEGVTNRTQTLSLAGLAERPSSMYAKGFKSILRSKSLGVMEKASLALGYGFNLAEIANRQVTALAAIRLAKARGMNDAETIKLTRDLIDQIHFEYASETKPRFLRHPIAQVTLQFKNYAQQMTAFLVQAVRESFPSKGEMDALLLKSQDKGLSQEDRDAAKREHDEIERVKKAARKRLTGVLGMTGLFAGYEGLPLYWVLEGTMNLIFDDEDEPYDFSLEMKVNLANMFGDNVARAFSKGPMSELLQVDVSRFANLNGLWFRDDAVAKDEEEWTKNVMIDMLGPAAGFVLNVAGGIKKINEGHYARGMEEMSPPVVKDFFKAWRFYHEGATTLRGDPIVPDIGLWGIFAQSLGFTPQDLQRSYEAMGEIKGLDKQLAQREQRLMSKLYLAYKSGDYEAYSDIGEEIIRYNSKNPGNEIDEKKIRRSFAQRERMSERAEKGIIVSAKRPELLEKTVYLED